MITRSNTLLPHVLAILGLLVLSVIYCKPATIIIVTGHETKMLALAYLSHHLTIQELNYRYQVIS